MARKKKPKVFVSYSRHDEALVRPLAGLLGVASSGVVFMDVASLQPGDHWEKEILEAVQQASVFVLCWCCECEKSDFVAREIGTALSDPAAPGVNATEMEHFDWGDSDEVQVVVLTAKSAGSAPLNPMEEMLRATA